MIKALLLLLLMVSAAAAEPVEIVIVGDVLPHNKAQQQLLRKQSPFGDFTNDLLKADISLGNLECVISSKGQPEQKPFTFRASPKILPELKRYFTGMSIANNHSVDYGTEAFVDMLNLAGKINLPLFGGGVNIMEAHRPLVIRKNNKLIAVLGYNDFLPRYFEALHDQPGIAWLDDDIAHQVIYNVRKSIKPDLLIVMPHWGIEEEKQPTSRQRATAQKLLDFGADVVVGGHPHVTQGHEIYNGKLIVYSLGNFLFDEYTSNPETRKSWLLRLQLDADNNLTWEIVNAYLDKDGIPWKKPRP